MGSIQDDWAMAHDVSVDSHDVRGSKTPYKYQVWLFHSLHQILFFLSLSRLLKAFRVLSPTITNRWSFVLRFYQIMLLMWVHSYFHLTHRYKVFNISYMLCVHIICVPDIYVSHPEKRRRKHFRGKLHIEYQIQCT